MSTYQRPAAPRQVPAATLAAMKQGATEAARHAYAPYSRFAVGAAVLCADGRIHTGANVENASFGLSICAERTAIFRAVADGARRIDALVVYTPNGRTTPPCGACRQVLAEFGADALIVCCTDDAGERRFLLADLLPDAFGPDHL
ncbi:MAG: cytidine deaminase [Casimicrobiaceae bacterium]